MQYLYTTIEKRGLKNSRAALAALFYHDFNFVVAYIAICYFALRSKIFGRFFAFANDLGVHFLSSRFVIHINMQPSPYSCVAIVLRGHLSRRIFRRGVPRPFRTSFSVRSFSSFFAPLAFARISSSPDTARLAVARLVNAEIS